MIKQQNSLAAVSQAEVLHALSQRYRFARLNCGQIIHHPPQAFPATQHGPRRAWRLSKRFHFHAIPAHQADKAQRRRQLFRVLQLRRRAKIHRRAGIDQREEMQILFFEEQLQEQLVEPGISVPIDESQIVAGHVIAEIGKLDALTFPFAAAFPFHAAAKNLARHELQSLELREQLRR